MNRRRFLATTAQLLPAAIPGLGLASVSPAGSEVPLFVDLTHTVAIVPPDFVGLGYEISSVARPGLLSTTNAVYLQLVRTLAGRGVFRVGGNTADYSSYSATGAAVSSPEGKAGSVVNDAVLRDLGNFLRATGWRLIWGLNLGSSRLDNAIAEARAVSRTTGDQLLAFEIGNEPDLFPRVHRPADYGYDAYLREFRTYRETLQTAIPGIAFAGPDVATGTDWVRKFASDERHNIKLLTHHYYRDGAHNPASTIHELLHPDPRLPQILKQLFSASQSSGLPYRICETNSFFGGGKPGVSDTLASALWVLDFMFTLASAGCGGVNMETGVNQLGFISSYSPIGDDERGHYYAAPEYYGMLAFTQAAPGRILRCTLGRTSRNIKAFATLPDDNHLVLTVIDKEASRDVAVLVDRNLRSKFRSASLMRLSGPSIDGKSGITLGGSMVSEDGSWKAARTEEFPLASVQAGLQVPRASAAMVHLHR
jgi:hypothetical protein